MSAVIAKMFQQQATDMGTGGYYAEKDSPWPAPEVAGSTEIGYYSGQDDWENKVVGWQDGHPVWGWRHKVTGKSPRELRA